MVTLRQDRYLHAVERCQLDDGGSADMTRDGQRPGGHPQNCLRRREPESPRKMFVFVPPRTLASLGSGHVPGPSRWIGITKPEIIINLTIRYRHDPVPDDQREAC